MHDNEVMLRIRQCALTHHTYLILSVTRDKASLVKRKSKSTSILWVYSNTRCIACFAPLASRLLTFPFTLHTPIE